MLITTSFLLVALGLSQVEGRPLKHRPSPLVSMDRAFYVRAVPNNANFTVEGTLPSGQDSALGRLSFGITSTGEMCWDIDTEGIEWDRQPGLGNSALCLKDNTSGAVELMLPDTPVLSTRNGLQVSKSSGCRPFSNLIFTKINIEDLNDDWDELLAEIRVAGFDGVTLEGPLIEAEVEVEEPATFTSHFHSEADGTQVINGDGTSNPGPEGARATFDFSINSDEEIICYTIEASGISGEYFNAGRTATHLGGLTGPSAFPRITFPNPQPVDSSRPDGSRRSSGCKKGPFASGRVENSVDSGSQSGFTLKKFEQDSSPYFVDMHTFDHAVGVVRGALQRVA